MRHSIIVSIVTIMLSTFSGCRNSIVDDIRHAETLIDIDPDSAIKILDSIDRRKLSHNSDQALFALLKSQAMDKVYQYTTNDSLIKIAADYYDGTHDIRRRMLSHYYLGRVYFESNDEDLKSCIEFIKAEELAKTLSDHYFLGLIYRNLSSLHLRNYNVSEAHGYSEKSLDEFKQTDKKLHIKYAYLNLARAKYNDRRIDEGISLLNDREILDWAAEDTMYDYNRLRILLPLYLINKDSTNSIVTLHKLETNKYFQPDTKYYAYAAEVSIKYTHNLQHGKMYMDSMSADVDPIGARILLNDLNVLYYTNTNDFKKALEARNDMMELQDSLVTLSLNRSLISAQKDILEQDAKLIESQRIKDRIVSISIIATLILIIVILSLIFTIRYRKRKTEIYEAVNALQSLRDELSTDADGSDNDIKTQIHNLIGSQLQAIDTIFAAYYLNQQTESDSKLNKILGQTVTRFRSDDCIYSLQQIIDRYNNNLITRLRNSFPGIKSDDVIFMTYIFAGFSPRSVCLFTNTPYKYYYTRTTRLRQYFSQTQHPDSEIFIEELTRSARRKR